VLRGATQIGSGNSARTGVDASLLPGVRAVPGVADAQPYLEGCGQLLGRDGKPIGGNGPPTEAANWVSDPALNPYRLVAGHAPQADDEVVINWGAAKTGHLALGMTTTLLTPQPLRVHVVGITTFGTADGFGPGTFTGMTLHAARLHLARSKGSGAAELSQILVRASPGVPDTELAARLRPVLPAGVQAITGAQLATENLDDLNSGFLGFLSTGLTAFAAVALLVAAFSIYNTFSILAAQRGRESALLRALGGTRRQLAMAGLAETLVVGLVGAVAGWAGGIGIATLLKGLQWLRLRAALGRPGAAGVQFGARGGGRGGGHRAGGRAAGAADVPGAAAGRPARARGRCNWSCSWSSARSPASWPGSGPPAAPPG
jgi:putative ABC transport system permease protein